MRCLVGFVVGLEVGTARGDRVCSFLEPIAPPLLAGSVAALSCSRPVRVQLSPHPRASLIGDLSGAKRTIVLFGADGADAAPSWPAHRPPATKLSRCPRSLFRCRAPCRSLTPTRPRTTTSAAPVTSDQPWEKAFGALAQGSVADGEVTIILERAREGTKGSYWRPLPVRMPAAMEAAEAEAAAAEAAIAAGERAAAAAAAAEARRAAAAAQEEQAGPSGRAGDSPGSAAAASGVLATLDRVLGESSSPSGDPAATAATTTSSSDDELEWDAALRAEAARAAESRREAELEELEQRRFRPEADDPGLNIALVGALGTLGLLLLSGFFP